MSQVLFSNAAFLAGLAALAMRLSKRENSADVTAHVYGNNVPAILAYTLSIFLPVYLQTQDQTRAWAITAAAVAIGVGRSRLIWVLAAGLHQFPSPRMKVLPVAL